jgi:uncharacterized protein YeaO (DUF488 family)
MAKRTAPHEIATYHPRKTTRVEAARVYDAGPNGRHRVLVDRLWPRGLAKSEAAIDEWLKDAAPSTELRRWYGHDVERYDEFVRRYRRELAHSPGKDAVAHLRELCATTDVQLLTATRDLEHSGARVLADHLAEHL